MSQSTFGASLVFHPLGRVSKAFLSALLLRSFDVDLLSPIISPLFLGRPRSMILVLDSDCPRRCPRVGCGTVLGSVSAFGVALTSGVPSLGVLTTA